MPTPPSATSPQPAEEHPRYQRLSPFMFHRKLAASTGTCLLVFVSEHCGACRSWKTVLRDLVAGDETLTVFEVDALHDAGLAHEFSVFHLPSLFLFMDGRYHCRLQATIASIRTAINEALAAPAEEPP